MRALGFTFPVGYRIKTPGLARTLVRSKTELCKTRKTMEASSSMRLEGCEQWCTASQGRALRKVCVEVQCFISSN